MVCWGLLDLSYCTFDRTTLTLTLPPTAASSTLGSSPARIGTWSNFDTRSRLQSTTCSGATHKSSTTAVTSVTMEWTSPSDLGTVLVNKGGTTSAIYFKAIVGFASGEFGTYYMLTQQYAVDVPPSSTPRATPTSASTGQATTTPKGTPAGTPEASFSTAATARATHDATPSVMPSKAATPTVTPVTGGTRGATPSVASTPQATPSCSSTAYATPRSTPSNAGTPGPTASSSASAAATAASTPAATPLPSPVCSSNTDCNSHGTCTQGVCYCDPAYTGALCASCVSGAFSSGGRCTVPTDADLQAALRIVSDFDTTAGTAGSTRRAQFVTEFITELEVALGLRASANAAASGRTTVLSVVRGSVVVTFKIAAADAGTSGPSTSQVLTALTQQVQSPTSALRSGSLMQAVNSDSLQSIQLGSPAVVPAQPAYSVTLSSAMKIEWSFMQSSGSLIPKDSVSSIDALPAGAMLATRVTCTGASSGYCAACWRMGSPRMVGSTCLLGDGTSWRVAELVSESDQVTVSIADSSVQGGASQVVSGSVQVEAIIPLDMAMKQDGTTLKTLLTGSGSSDASVVWAKAGGSVSSPSFHGNDRGEAQVNYATGSFQVVSSNTVVILHGLAMALAWLLLSPTGVAAAAVLKRTVKKSAGTAPLWWRLHRPLQIAAVVFTLGGFIVILAGHDDGEGDDEDGGEGGGEHTGSMGAHGTIGIIVTIAASVHALWAMFRPHNPNAGEPTPCIRTAWVYAHRGLGYLLTIGALVNVFTGLEYTLSAGGAVGIMVAALFAVAGFTAWLHFHSRTQVRDEVGEVQMVQEGNPIRMGGKH